MPLLTELKSAKRVVESAIRLFGPANVTSILDRHTFADRLVVITTKLETYIEKAEEVITELEELKVSEVETEINCQRKIDEVNILTEAIIKKVNDNEYEVKMKIEEVIREFEANKDKSSLSSTADIPEPSQLPRNEYSKTNQTEKPREHSTLSKKIEEYDETGPFLTHLPEFIYLIKYVISQYQKKLPLFGQVVNAL